MPAVTRIGDADLTHCSAMTRAQGSDTVFVNDIGVSFQTCINTSHLLPRPSDCVLHTAPITTGSTTVTVHEKGVGRVGDALTSCTAVSAGSENVFCGG